MVPAMLLLLFKAGDGHFAMDTSMVVEIVPFLNMKKIPSAPGYVLGLVNFRGKPIPVVDLCQLTTGCQCESKLSTRIILIQWNLTDGKDVKLGLVAEQVYETIQSNLQKSPPAGVIMDESLLGTKPQMEVDEMIQWLDLKHLLPGTEIDELFTE
jgi:chemotaxis-related protein WspB